MIRVSHFTFDGKVGRLPEARAVCDGCGRRGPPVECKPTPPGRPDEQAMKLARQVSDFVEAWTPAKGKRVAVTVRDLCLTCAQSLQPGEYLPCLRCGWPQGSIMHAAACTVLAIRDAETTPSPDDAAALYKSLRNESA